MNAIIPPSPLTIREATLADIPFIDALQKKHSRQVGWMPTKQLEGKIAAKQVLVAEEVGSKQKVEGGEMPSLSTAYCPLPTPLGYLIAQDQYFKRDDVGIIYQMNVVPGHQRGLVGASLLKAQFEKSAWGCKLYCCWCAQDIEANRFWEAMGFVPLAFRAGSEKKARVHIFWQRRIRAGDVTTPYWFPAQTSGGSLREDRLVLPIPPGTHWNDAKPMVLPGERGPGSGCRVSGEDKKQLPSPHRNPEPGTQNPSAKPAMGGKLSFGNQSASKANAAKSGEARAKRKNDPRMVSAARELRDRWLEEVNANPAALCGIEKYNVARVMLPAQKPFLIEGSAADVPLIAAA